MVENVYFSKNNDTLLVARSLWDRGKVRNMQGLVKNFNKEKGYGFITADEGQDIFFHYSELKMDGFKTVSPSQKVEFDVEETEKGLRAVNIRLVD